MSTLQAQPSTIEPLRVAPETTESREASESNTLHTGQAHVAHHFDSAPQQFSASKLGMWLFLGTELLFFGGLFCYYAVFRSLHPEIFEYGSQFLNTWLGGVNTMVLILSSMTMAAGVTFAQRGQARRLAAALALTLAGGATFMVIKYFEYSHKIHDGLVWGAAFYERPVDAASHEDDDGAAEESVADAGTIKVAAFTPDPAKGQELWMNTCRSCHGVGGEGIVGQGKDIRGSEFIASKTDEELLAFVKVGRMPFDSLNTTGLQMPPRGGNPLLKDDDLRHILSYVRTFKAPQAGAAPGAAGMLAEAGAAEAPGGPRAEESNLMATSGDAAEGDATESSARATGAIAAGASPGMTAPPKQDIYIFKSVVPPADRGAPGLVDSYIFADGPPAGARGRSAVFATSPGFSGDPAAREDEAVPRDAHIFFNAYFMLTGLHGIHVLAGMGVITWLLVGALRGRFGPGYFTPVDLGGLYWHLVDLIWIFLFPLLYLI